MIGETPRRYLRPGEPGWPDSLNDLEHLRGCPPLRGLWCQGSAGLASPAVAIVGARRASASGMAVAREIAWQLAACGVTVVSGFAVGIDAAAHQGALEARGNTTAILGCGLDTDYPRQHRELRQRVVACGAILSEYESADPPDAWRFPRRNRIIAAIARAVIVVEAAPASGALSTARWAADLGREVLAVPGSIRGEMNAGSNRLIRDGARPFLDLDDLSDLLPAIGRGCSPGAAEPGGPASERLLLDRIGSDPVHPDDVAAAMGLGAAELAVSLGGLELAGVVRSLPGGLIQRVRGRQ